VPVLKKLKSIKNLFAFVFSVFFKKIFQDAGLPLAPPERALYPVSIMI